MAPPGRTAGPTTIGSVLSPPPASDDWVALTSEPLELAVASEWVGRPQCGAVVVFSGLVREQADGVTGVTHIDYEAWAEEVVPRLGALADDARRRWPAIGRIVLWHREGRVALGESSVVVAVSTPHRGEAFAAAEHLIDTLKATVPIWKKEYAEGGSQWARAAQHITALGEGTGTRVDA